MEYSGKVIWFSNKKGYGFIKYNDKDIFFHFSDILKAGFKTVNKGDSVRFMIGANRNGDEKAISISVNKEPLK